MKREEKKEGMNRGSEDIKSDRWGRDEKMIGSNSASWRIFDLGSFLPADFRRRLKAKMAEGPLCC